MVKPYLTSSQAIDALGGTAKVARIFGLKPNVVSNWRKRGLPSHAEARLWHECKKRRINYVPPAVQEAQEQAAAQ
jgi:hypothetical protein